MERRTFTRFADRVEAHKLGNYSRRHAPHASRRTQSFRYFSVGFDVPRPAPDRDTERGRVDSRLLNRNASRLHGHEGGPAHEPGLPFRDPQGLRIERVGVDAHDLTPRAVADCFFVGLKGSVLAGAQFALYPLEVLAHVATEAHASDDDLSSFSFHDGQVLYRLR